MAQIDPRGPIRQITKVERTKDATLVSMECGHTNEWAPRMDDAIVKHARKALKIYRDYGRGSLSWSEGIQRLLALGVDPAIAGRVLLGTHHIPGQ
jgi:hypothetical protein